MNSLMLKMKVALRAETTLAKIYIRQLINKAVLSLIAVVFLSITLVMLNIAAYNLFAEHMKVSSAAFVLALINLALGVIPLLMARNQKPGPEADMALEIRELALNELNNDLQDFQEKVSEVGDDVKKIQRGFTSLKDGGLSKAALIEPLLALIIQFLKRKQ